MSNVQATNAQARDVTVKRVDELEYFYHGAYGRLRAGLGVRGFGIQVVRLEPHADIYPAHDHADDGQEEVYLTFAGKATLIVAQHEYTLEPGVAIRVGPLEMRRVVTGDVPVELIVIGGVPGRAYRPSPYTELGAPLAVASASPTSVNVGEEVMFDGSDSTAGSGTEGLSFAWDFEGSGSFVETGLPRAAHRYERPGTYVARLRVTDGAGRTDTDKVRIHVQ